MQSNTRARPLTTTGGDSSAVRVRAASRWPAPATALIGRAADVDSVCRLAAAGFSRFRRAAETPFTIAYEARP